MDNYKSYLHLRVNGKLIIEDLKRPDRCKNFIKDIQKNTKINGKAITFDNIKRGHNINNPIPYTLLSNMIACLSGGIPVPTKPKRRKAILNPIERNPVYDELALNAYYKLDNNFYEKDKYIKTVVTPDGEYYHIIDVAWEKNKGKFESLPIGGSEIWQTRKLAINSTTPLKTKLLTFKDGKEKILDGMYTEQMLDKAFNNNKNDETYCKLRSFISDLLGCNNAFDTYTFSEMTQAIYDKEESDPTVKAKVMDFAENIKKSWADNFSAWMDAIFNYNPGKNKKFFYTKSSGSNNTAAKEKSGKMYATRTTLANRTGISYLIPISGDIIVELTDRKQEENIRNNSGFCTFLEGGLCKVVEIKKYEPVIGYKEKWTKISSENPAYPTENKNVI